MNIVYRKLFTIDLLHDYYIDELCNDFEIIPSEETLRLFNNHQILYRQFGNKFIALIHSQVQQINGIDTGFYEPARPFEEPIKFTFYLKLKNQYFSSFTNLGNKIPSGVFYWSNLSQNKQKDVLYLSQKISQYDANNDYHVGDLAATGLQQVFESIRTNLKAVPAVVPPIVSHNLADTKFWMVNKTLLNYNDNKDYKIGDIALSATTHQVFVAIKDNPRTDLNAYPPTTSHDLSDANFWSPGTDGNQYVSKEDSITPVNSVFNYNLEVSSQNISVQLFALDPGSLAINDYSVLAFSETQIFSQPVNSVQVNTEKLNLPRGKYRLVVNTAEKFIYIDNSIASNKYFGVIEIFQQPGLTPDFKLLEPTGIITEKIFTLRFKNRSTIWKFISAKKNGIAATSPDWTFSKVEDSIYQSTVPIPITEKPLKGISVHWQDDNTQGSGDLPDVKNAGAGSLKKTSITFGVAPNATTVDYDCSEIFLNI